MKFIKLEILNLASLDRKEGEVICFEEGALGESNIFSIVGPTGSGKSTILDAICLALYNRTPRYPRKKGDHNQNIKIFGTPEDEERNRLAPTDSRNILTYGKREGYSKLTFLANNGNVYRAEWHVEFKRVKYGDPTTLLYKIVFKDGIPVEETADWKELPQIIGLDYEQFLRTVLIAQGSFANFLTAKEDERYELLEKLIGCEEQYITIVREIQEKKNAAKDAFKQINSSVEVLSRHVLDEAHLKTLDEEIDRLTQAEKELNNRMEAVKKDLQWYAEEENRLKEITGLTAKADAAKANVKQIEESVNRLMLRDSLLPAMERMRETNRLSEAIANAERQTALLAQGILDRQESIQKENIHKATLEGQVTDAQKAIEETAPHILKARELKTRLETASKTLTEKKEATTAAQKEKEEADKASRLNEERINQAVERKEILTKELERQIEGTNRKKEELAKAERMTAEALQAESAKTAGVNVDSLQLRKDETAQDLNDLVSAIEVTSSIASTTAEIKEKEIQRNTLEKENADISENLSKLIIPTLTQETEALKEAYTLMTSEQWGMHRDKLKDGSPCPLCGSKEHPYQSDPQQLDETTEALKRMYEEKKKTLENQQNEEKRLSGVRQENEGKLKTLLPSLGKLDTDLRTLHGKWETIQVRHEEWQPDKAVLEALRPAHEERKKNAEEELKRYYSIQAEIIKLSKQKETASTVRSDYEKESATRMEQLKNAVTEADKQLTGYLSLKDNLANGQTEKQNALNAANASYNEAEKEANGIKEKLQAELGGKDPDQEEKRLASVKQTADKALADKTQEIAKLQEALGKLIGQADTVKTQKQTHTDELAQKTADLHEWIAQYNEVHKTFISQETITTLLLAKDDWEAIRKDKDDKNQALHSAEAVLQSAIRKHTEAQASKPEPSQEELTETLAALQTQSRIQELVDARAKRKNHEDALRDMGDKAEELRIARQHHDDWTAITDAIGTDGKTLRKIAQCYTLRFLIEHANAEIRKFNSRYELVQVKNSLGIRVIDHDRADDIRDTTSLSGGETFIVSLGLALGLSSLSSRNISFENLFIDEGFGTLDPDTLTTVIDSLAMLQSSQGKKVGVISHTDTMSERITTQIRVIRNGNSGSSHIEIYP